MATKKTETETTANEPRKDRPPPPGFGAVWTNTEPDENPVASPDVKPEEDKDNG